MKTFKLIPILGTKTDVLPDDITMLQMAGQGVAFSHDAGGVNFSLKRQKNAAVKALGKIQKSNTAIASASLNLGLFELYDGTNRNFINFDHGKMFKYDSSWDPSEVSDTASTTFATDPSDLYSMIRVGAYMVFADRAEHTPYKWKHGDAALTKLAASGTEYKFRYLVSFQRRVIGLYSDQTNGDIDVRWSTAWPGTAITSLNFPATNQLYIPNDDTITGGATLGTDKCYITCRDSVQQLVYYPDYSTPFRAYTIVPDQGCASHHSIIQANGLLYWFNENLGFVSYNGGNILTPISDDILPEIQTMNPSYHSLIGGLHNSTKRQLLWSVPLDASSSCNAVVIYNYDTGQWEIETNKTARCLDEWLIYTTQTWTTLEALVGGTGLWSDAGSARWADYTTYGKSILHANTDGHIYTHASESNAGADFAGFREEPIMWFGNPRRFDNVLEIWFDIGEIGNFAIDINYRTGNTVGELMNKGWENLGTISCSSPYSGRLPVNKNARLHQLKWGTSGAGEKFVVNGITFLYSEGSEV